MIWTGVNVPLKAIDMALSALTTARKNATELWLKRQSVDRLSTLILAKNPANRKQL
jgi:hypothetical protein